VRLVGEAEYDTRIVLPGRDELTELADRFNTMTHGLWERAKMSRYLSKAALEAVREAAETRLWGEQTFGTILFTDIRSFTTVAENTDPLGVVKLLNEYFTCLTEGVTAHGGDIDKFVGDAMLAVFKPEPADGPHRERHVARAVRCGLALREALEALNRRRRAFSLEPLQVGIGINTGDLIAGNIGAPGRMDHTVIGDTVNIALRLNKMSRQGRHTRIIISRTTLELAGGIIEAERLPGATLKGKTQAVEMFEIVRARPAADSPVPPHGNEV